MISYNIRTYISVILFLAFGTYLLLFLTTQNLSSINILIKHYPKYQQQFHSILSYGHFL